MEKFNAIKLLEEEKNINQLMSINIPKQQYVDKLNKFMDNYVYPKIDKLDIYDEDFLENFKINAYQLAYKVSNINSYNGEDNIVIYKNIHLHILNKNDINFINKDKKTKERVSTLIINSIIDSYNKIIESNDN